MGDEADALNDMMEGTDEWADAIREDMKNAARHQLQQRKRNEMKLNNCPVKWAYVHEPTNSFPPPVWSINVYLSAAQVEEVRAHGIEVKTDEDGSFITAKRKTKSKEGKAIQPPRVVDMNKQPFSKEIGNGSVCNIIMDAYPWEFNKKRGVGAWLNAVQVVEWKEYVGKEDFDGPANVPGEGMAEEDF